MSQINVNRIKDSNEGAPDFPSGVNVGGITSTVTLGVTNLTATNVNVSGVVTATTLDGSLLATGTPTLGLGVTINTSGLNISGVATAGIVSATTLYGNGANITGIALTIAPLNYNPALNSQASHIAKASGIGLTFNQAVKAGSGNVTLSLANAGVAGTVVENFGVGNSVTYSTGPYGTIITITPTADLSSGQDYHLSYPSGAFTNIGGDLSSVGIAYTFKGRELINQLWSWGNNQSGMLGLNNIVGYSSPIQIPGTGWSTLGHNTRLSTFVIKDDNTLWAWGRNNEGQLGQNSINSPASNGISSPTQIPGTTWKEISSAENSVAAIKTDGTLWAWGDNNSGQLGQNAPVNSDKSSPTQIPGSWSKVRCISYAVIATKTNGTLWSWGQNHTGKLGQNSSAPLSSPTQIPGTTWNNITSGYYAMFATKTDGTLWSWGYGNSQGGLGLNDRIARSSPTQIPGTNWSTVSASYMGAGAIKTDGTLWTWGRNASGQLGLNTISSPAFNGVSSPTQVPGTTWSIHARGAYYTMAIKTDGTLWGWGRGGNGQLGQNTDGNPANRSSPVQIPGTSWVDVNASYFGNMAIKGG
jgi:alpha-tubulin suppressor-like RCC1 family protein